MKKIIFILIVVLLCSCKKDDKTYVQWRIVVLNDDLAQREVVDSICRTVAEEENFIKQDDHSYLIPVRDIDEGQNQFVLFEVEVYRRMNDYPDIELSDSVNVTGLLDVYLMQIDYSDRLGEPIEAYLGEYIIKFAYKKGE